MTPATKLLLFQAVASLLQNQLSATSGLILKVLYQYLDLPTGAESMIRGAHAAHTPSLGIETAPFGKSRTTWYKSSTSYISYIIYNMYMHLWHMKTSSLSFTLTIGPDIYFNRVRAPRANDLVADSAPNNIPSKHLLSRYDWKTRVT